MRIKPRFAPLAATLALEPRLIERPGVMTPTLAPADWSDARVEAWLDWAERLPNADALILDRAQIDAQNARMRAQDSHIQDIAALPAQLDAAQVRASIGALSSWPTRALYNDKGQAIAPGLPRRHRPTGWW